MFFARGVEPAVAPQILKDKHLVLALAAKEPFSARDFFRWRCLAVAGVAWDMAFRLNADEYEGETRLQIHVEALRAAAPIE